MIPPSMGGGVGQRGLGMAYPNIPTWRQIDAGIWQKQDPPGFWEICFATDSDGSPTFELAAYDCSTHWSGERRDSATFGSLETARAYADGRRLETLVADA